MPRLLFTFDGFFSERTGMPLVEIADAVGTKYPNLSAIENDCRMDGLTIARKLGEVLTVDYRRFIE